ncbi:macro domain-containing protein [Azospirillum sp. TSO5]|uniref:macro domain-containing protein n=1 Tax=Azospirillum sp. TSO5 TaxID=716760 RepID=UPI000D651DC2|nr:macro domain-containing protein [Azospirillum sp. TSO5]
MMSRVTPSPHMHRARQVVEESLAGLTAKPPVGYRAETSQFSCPHWQAELALWVRVLAAGLSVGITETSMRDVGDDGRMLCTEDGRPRIAIRADGQHLDGAFCLASDEGRIAAGVHRSVVTLRLLGAELARRSLPWLRRRLSPPDTPTLDAAGVLFASAGAAMIGLLRPEDDFDGRMKLSRLAADGADMERSVRLAADALSLALSVAEPIVEPVRPLPLAGRLDGEPPALTLHAPCPALLSAFREAFDGVSGVAVTDGDILDTGCAAIVSPANSFGFMDGGLDIALARRFGWGVAEAVQQEIMARPLGELLVGEAVVVPTRDSTVRWLIAAPTMRAPEPLRTTVNSYLAMKSVALACRGFGIPSVACPGLGTGIGEVKPLTAARQMARAWRESALSEGRFPVTVQEAADRHDLLALGRA